MVSTPTKVKPIQDLRDWLDRVEGIGELVRVRQPVDWNEEMGAITYLVAKQDPSPAVLFERVRGYENSPIGARSLWNLLGPSFRRIALTHEEPPDLPRLELIRRVKEKMNQRTPPREVSANEAPVFENTKTGSEVDLGQLPIPKHWPLDGGRYLGTADLVITRDPDSGWANLGTYRVQVHDAKTLTVFIEPGKHGNLIRQKYWDRGEPCPMVVVVGQAPILGRLAGSSSRHGESELDVAGGRLGRPIQVVRGKLTGLPFPADAEIVFEGYVPPREVEAREEGPFGEWPGYYGSDSRPEPVLQVKAIYHRNDPIMTGQPPAKPTYPGRHGNNVPTAAAIWDALEAAGVPGVKGVWKLQGGGSRFITVVAIEQQHPGHAKMAGLVATGCGPAAYLGRMTIVVDDDVDITNPTEVIWALATRWDPKTGTDIVDGCWTGHIDPLLDPVKRERMDITNSRAILYAVRPYHWKDEFPRVNEVPAAYAQEVRARWADKLDFLRKLPR